VLGSLALAGIWQVFQESGTFRAGACFQVTSKTGILPADGLRQVVGRGTRSAAPPRTTPR
jgi:hypothetical protein